MTYLESLHYMTYLESLHYMTPGFTTLHDIPGVTTLHDTWSHYITWHLESLHYMTNGHNIIHTSFKLWSNKSTIYIINLVENNKSFNYKTLLHTLRYSTNASLVWVNFQSSKFKYYFLDLQGPLAPTVIESDSPVFCLPAPNPTPDGPLVLE